MSNVQACLNWCRDRLGWSKSAQSSQEQLSGLALLAGVLVLAVWGRGLPFMVQVLFWSLLALAGAYLLRRGWLKLFGPVLFYDMIRQARRSRYFVLRMGYAGLLIFFLFITYIEFQPSRRGHFSPQELHLRMAEAYFFQFITIQFIAISLLTPAYVGGAIADEKERKTLEFMLATDLRNREIVLSKLVSRLANLTLIILIGLPILSFLQFLGGIDPNLLLAGFAATFLTMFGLAGFSIFASVYFPKPRDAIVFAYMGPLVYVALGLLGLFIKFSGWGWVAFSIGFGSWSFSIADLIDIYNSGNLPIILVNIGNSFSSGQMTYLLGTSLRDYAIFQLLVGGACTTWAVLRLRIVALAQAHGTTQKTRMAHKIRPEVWDYSLLWKEIFVDDRARASWLSRFVVGILFLLTVGLGVARFAYTWYNYGQIHESDAAEWATMVGTAVSCLVILAAAVRASTCISGERDKDTLDFLLTTPLDSDTILWAKFLGCLLNMRRAFIWLGIIWGMAILAGGMTIPATLVLFLALLVYLSAFIMVGMWFSMTAKSSMRATVGTILTIFAISGGHWLFTACCLATANSGREFEGLIKFQAGMTPPFVLGFLHYIGYEFGRHGAPNDAIELLVYCLVGLAVYVAASLFFWSFLSALFREMTGRNPRTLENHVPGTG